MTPAAPGQRAGCCARRRWRAARMADAHRRHGEVSGRVKMQRKADATPHGHCDCRIERVCRDKLRLQSTSPIGNSRLHGWCGRDRNWLPAGRGTLTFPRSTVFVPRKRQGRKSAWRSWFCPRAARTAPPWGSIPPEGLAIAPGRRACLEQPAETGHMQPCRDGRPHYHSASRPGRRRGRWGSITSPVARCPYAALCGRSSSGVAPARPRLERSAGHADFRQRLQWHR
jgi:hypothetical protein